MLVVETNLHLLRQSLDWRQLIEEDISAYLASYLHCPEQLHPDKG
jgi:hypothetical protein